MNAEWCNDLKCGPVCVCVCLCVCGTAAVYGHITRSCFSFWLDLSVTVDRRESSDSWVTCSCHVCVWVCVCVCVWWRQAADTHTHTHTQTDTPAGRHLSNETLGRGEGWDNIEYVSLTHTFSLTLLCVCVCVCVCLTALSSHKLHGSKNKPLCLKSEANVEAYMYLSSTEEECKVNPS